MSFISVLSFLEIIMITWTVVRVMVWARPHGRVASYYRCDFNHVKDEVLTDAEALRRTRESIANDPIEFHRIRDALLACIDKGDYLIETEVTA
jgi:hypothetical protein